MSDSNWYILTVSRRFNTHVSALFGENETLREQYEILTSFLFKELTRLFRMLADMRDLIKRYA